MSRVALPVTALAAAVLAAAWGATSGASLRAALASTPDPASSLSSSSTARDAAPRPSAVAGAADASGPTSRQRATARPLAPATDVRLAPGPRGGLGAWLVAGPFRAAKPALDAVPQGADETASPSAGAALGGERDLGGKKRLPPARWLVASTHEGAIDLKAALGATGSELVAYAAGQLHVERAGRYTLMLGVDDGVRVSVDGTVVLAKDEARALRDDDDLVPLDLSAGDHDVLVKLHQRDGAWLFRARVVDATMAPPEGAHLRLPGTTADDARALAAKMSWVSLERAFDASSDPPVYRPRLTVRFPEGAPRGVPLPVASRLLDGEQVVFDVDAGGVAVTNAGAGELVVTLPSVARSSGALSLETSVAGRSIKHTLPARPATEQALARATKVLAAVAADAPWLPDASRTSVAYLSRRLAGLLARGDADAEAQLDEARELDRLAAALEKGVDPYQTKTGVMRRAIRSRHDGEPTELGLYVPTWYRPGTKARFPLVVALHGLNGYALGMMRWVFGGDDPNKEQGWEDRHVGTLPAIDAFVVTPQAHGNTLYRELGEDDVMQVVDWVMRTYPIDPSRVTITGPSMGGIGSAALPLRRPHVFAGAMPLCGYHSYLIRSDVAGRPLRPWERFLAEERSNALWADNGEHLPLFVVHGTQDKPEDNSGVLVERYDKLGYPITHEHPEAGHNVWQRTYEDLKGLKWLLRRRLDLHPSHVRFRTTRTRWAKSAWVSIDELESESAWAEVDARARGRSKVTVATTGVAELSLTRDPQLLSGALVVSIDGQSVAFDDAEPIVLHHGGAGWKKGPRPREGLVKRGTVTGPIRDAFHEPLVFVYGAEGAEARANEEVARAFARVRSGVQVAYPVLSDAEFSARGEPLANDRALFLVGRRNRVLAALHDLAPMPILVEEGAVVVGSERITGKNLGAAFIRPNPARPDRYVVVVAGADPVGTLRAISLPDLLPDFVVWDEAVARSRGGVILGSGALVAGGFFKKDWSLPSSIRDPLAKPALGAPAASP